MDIILLPRRAGKTTSLIKRSAATGYYMVVRDRSAAQMVAQMAVAMELSIPFPITYSEFIDRRYDGKGVKGVLIDDAEALIYFLSNVTVGAISLTYGVADEHRKGRSSNATNQPIDTSTTATGCPALSVSADL